MITMAGISDVLVVLVVGGTLGWLSQRLNFRNAVAQVVLGVLLGYAVLGWVSHSPLLHTFGEVGVVLLLGVAGLEVGIDRLKAAGWAGTAVAVLGIVFSFAGGYGTAHVFGSPTDEALYLGLALGATSIGITVQVLEQFGVIAHRVADIVIAAAVIDDVIALYALGAVHGFLSEGLRAAEVLSFILLAIAVLGGLFAAFSVLTRWAVTRGLIDTSLRRGVWILTAVILGALVTHKLGLSSVVGAFFAGVGVGAALTGEARERSANALRPMVLVMMPFFFVMIGVQAQWSILDQAASRWFVLILIICAVRAKTLAGLLGATRIYRWRERWIIGFGMVARGEIALIIATVGLEQGHLSHPVFVALVLTTIAVTVLGPLLMAPFAKRLGSELSACAEQRGLMR